MVSELRPASERDQLFFFGLFCFCIVWGVMYFGRYVLWGLGPDGAAMFGMDFEVFWQAGRALRTGQFDQVYNAAVLETFLATGVTPKDYYGPFPYPPPALFLIAPLGFFSKAVAYWLWSAVGTAVFLWSLRAMQRQGMLPWFSAQRGMLWFALAAVMTSSFVIYAVIGGQTGMLVGGLLLGCLVHARLRPVLAGVLLGVLVFKPQVALLVGLMLLVTRNWRAAGAAVATGAALVALSLVMYGVDAWEHYFAMARNFSTLLAGSPKSFCPMGLSPFIALKCLGGDNSLAMEIQIAVSLGCLWLMWRLWGRSAQPAADLGFMLLLAANFLVSPYSMTYDLPVVACAMLLVFDRAMREGFLPRERVMLVLVFFFMLLVPALQPKHWIPISTAAMALTVLYYSWVALRARRGA